MSKSNKNIAIAFANGFRKRIVDECGGIYDLNKFFDIFFDTSNFMRDEKIKRFDDFFEHPKLITALDVEHFIKYIVHYNISYVLFYGFGGYDKYKAVTILQELKIKWGILHHRSDFSQLYEYCNKGKNLSGLFNLKVYLNKIKKKFKLLQLKPAHIFTNSDHNSLFPQIKKSTTHIPINYRDYYLSVSQPKPLEEPYAVFLDQALPFHFSDKHPDKKRHFYDNQRTDLYYSRVNSFLRSFSIITNCKIVVCLHPNCPDNLASNFDNQFMSVRYETSQYAKHASYIVAHYSCSLSYSFIYKIPTLFLCVDSAMPLVTVEITKNKAKSLKASAINWPSEHIVSSRIQPLTCDAITNWLIPVPEQKKLPGYIAKEIKKYLQNESKK